MRKAQKIDMAFEQLTDALDAYFAGRFHSAIVLGAAAEQLFAGYLYKYGLKPAYIHERSLITRLANALRYHSGDKETTEKDIGDFMNRVYNHSKHAGKADLEVWMDARDEARLVIDRAISNYDQVCLRPEHPLPDLPSAQKFRMETIRDLRAE
jgi:hypothetical protein